MVIESLGLSFASLIAKQPIAKNVPRVESVARIYTAFGNSDDEENYTTAAVVQENKLILLGCDNTPPTDPSAVEAYIYKNCEMYEQGQNTNDGFTSQNQYFKSGQAFLLNIAGYETFGKGTLVTYSGTMTVPAEGDAISLKFDLTVMQEFSTIMTVSSNETLIKTVEAPIRFPKIMMNPIDVGGEKGQHTSRAPGKK